MSRKRPNKFYVFVLLLIACTGMTVHAKTDVSLVMSDVNSRTAVEAVQEVYARHPGLKDTIQFRTYAAQNIDQEQLAKIGDSRIALVFMFDRTIARRLQDALTRVVNQGGAVYTLDYLFPGRHQELGFQVDKKVRSYYDARRPENMADALLYVLKHELGTDVKYDDPDPYPEIGIYDHHEDRIFEDVEAYRKHYAGTRHGYDRDDPWVGLIFYVSDLAGGQMDIIDALLTRLEKAGLNVIPAYGYPSEKVLETIFLRGDAGCSVDVIVSTAMKFGVNPEQSGRLLQAIDAPIINAISLYSQSAEEWHDSGVGLTINERTWQIAKPEMAGLIQPTVVGSKENRRDASTGSRYVAKTPIDQRVRRVVDRVQSWLRLRNTPERNKRIAVIYYNYPPGKQNIGASYLNVLPGSLWNILQKLKSAGYDVEGAPQSAHKLKQAVFHHRNLGNWAPAELDAFVRQYDPPRVSMETYRGWLKTLPPEFVERVRKKWGPPEESDVMVWTDENGQKHLVIPALQYGNIMLTAQPPRGWSQNLTSLYHDTKIPPHHQYVAFYLYMKKQFDAHALVHVGTHGTHEWLPGKEAGLEAADAPEALIQDIPNIYPYIVDDVGEGIQAKRRGQAVIIDHMTPPLDRSTLNPELRRLSGLIKDYNVAVHKSQRVAEKHLETIRQMAAEKGILKDLGLKDIEGDEDLEELEHYLKRLKEKATPFGLHTFGQIPEEKFRRSTARAIVESGNTLSPEKQKERLEEIDRRIVDSARRELDSLIAGLDGRYVPAGQGNDPIRNPDSLPTGKNFYSFDANRVPSPETYELGAERATELIEGYLERHEELPSKLTFTLWAVETIRHEGVTESQIMNLMGIRPTWDERGKVTGVEAIPREELGHPRLDVVMVPSGLYRDLFSNLMHLLDKAVSRAREQREADNILRSNIMSLRRRLVDQGIKREKASRLASVRMFTEETGSYGTGLCDVIPSSHSWEDEEEVAGVYFMRMGHLFGQGFWGNESVDGKTEGVDKKTAKRLLKKALSGTKMSVHSLSSSVYATLDNDDFFQYLGGTALAVRTLDGESPELYVSDMSNPNSSRQVPLERVMGAEMRSRYLNPKWIDEMLAEGYSGSRFVDRVVEHLWGWQVTAPKVVGDAKWQEMYETYVKDKYNLDVKQRMKDAGNGWAHQSIVARMLEVVRKGYWKPDRKVVERLAREYARSVEQEGLACCDHTCNNPALTEYTAQVMASVPGLKNRAKEFKQSLDDIKKVSASVASQRGEKKRQKKKTSSPSPDSSAGDMKQVQGYEMEKTTSSGASSAPIPYTFLVGFLTFLGLVAWGWKRRDR